MELHISGTGVNIYMTIYILYALCSRSFRPQLYSEVDDSDNLRYF